MQLDLVANRDALMQLGSKVESQKTQNMQNNDILTETVLRNGHKCTAGARLNVRSVDDIMQRSDARGSRLYSTCKYATPICGPLVTGWTPESWTCGLFRTLPLGHSLFSRVESITRLIIPPHCPSESRLVGGHQAATGLGRPAGSMRQIDS